MKRLYIHATDTTPEINFSPEENIFLIRGSSSPEDVREMYYPVIEWIRILVDDIIEGDFRKFNRENPLRFLADLEYFNSSSAKFFYDIFSELKRLTEAGFPVIVEWCYDNEDIDQKEAGIDIALLVEMEFVFISRKGKI
jgi:hypothetical protein